jgi:two-component system, cell cycle response regulator
MLTTAHTTQVVFMIEKMTENSNAMLSYQILPIGFSSHENAMIATFFKLAGRRSPHWGLTGRANDARVVLLNATSQHDVDAFKPLVAPWQRVIVVGESDFGTGWPVIQRPFKLTSVLHVLDDLTKSASISTKLAVLSRLAAIVPVPAIKPVPAPATYTLDKAPSFTAPVTVADTLVSNAPRKKSNDMMGRVLIVDDSDIALKFMQNRLRSFGYESELAKSGEEALVKVGKHRYQFVFLDVMMEGLDGYQTCRAIKNNKARLGSTPVVVMLTSRGGTIDKIRGSMAGCDAYLTKPLNEKQLTMVLNKYDESTISQRLEAIHPSAPLVDSYMPKQKQ